MQAAANSRPRSSMALRPSTPAVSFRASPFAPTAITAMTPTVIAVPTPITKVAATPVRNMPCASANTSTRIAPEQGRKPTAKIAPKPRAKPPGPASSAGVGPWLWPISIDEIDYRAKLKGPSWGHPLGADDLGRDILARMLYGGRISLAVGLAAMVATVMAVPIPITKVAAMPAQNRPCASENTSTRIAPEQGLKPTAKIAPRPRCQPPGPASWSGVGPCEWPE